MLTANKTDKGLELIKVFKLRVIIAAKRHNI